MAIKDLQARQGNVNLDIEVIEKGDVREFQKFGKPGRVCTAIVKDETGQCKLSLWNEQIDQVNTGDKLRISNGYVSEWQGELQLTAGRMGSIEVLQKGSSAEDNSKEDSQKADEPEQAMTDDEKTEEQTLDEPQKSDSGEHILTKDEAVEEEIIEEKKED